MNANEQLQHETTIAPLLHSIRGLRVILDTDLARLYGVETRALNQAVQRNRKKFPPDFMFELEREEIAGISQSVTSLGKLRFSKQVHAFAEYGAPAIPFSPSVTRRTAPRCSLSCCANMVRSATA